MPDKHVNLCFHGWRSWKRQPHLYSKAINPSSMHPSSEHIGSSHADCFIDIDQGKVSKHSSVSLTGADCCLCMLGEPSIKKIKPLFRSITVKPSFPKQTPTYTLMTIRTFMILIGSHLFKKTIFPTNCIIKLVIGTLKPMFTASFSVCPCYSSMTGDWKPHLQCKCYRSNDTLNSLYQYVVIQGLWALIKCH